MISTNQYRDNYYPLKELVGAIMQCEKYIFHLNKSGIKGEENIIKHFKKKHDLTLPINITNPKSIIIMGRSNELSKKQTRDFEIIKRQYSNITDIISYDDLLERLESVIKSFQ